MKMLFLIFSFAWYLQAHSLIHVIGDSHTFVFRGIPHCIQHHLGPVTMHRMGRDGFEMAKLRVNREDVVVFVFGEIDVRCHIGRQRDLKGRDLNEIIHTLATNYLHQIVTFFPNTVSVVYSVTPPTDIVNNPEFPIYGSLEDRIQFTRLLNQTLKLLCQTNGVLFLDVYDEYADEKGALCASLSDQNVHIHPECNGSIRKKLSDLLMMQTWSVEKTLSEIEKMIREKKKGAYLCFSKEDICMAMGKAGGVWDQLAMQGALAITQENILKGLFLPYTALHGQRAEESWAEKLFAQMRRSWNHCYAPLFPSFFSTSYQKECVRFFDMLRENRVLIIGDFDLPKPIQTLLFGCDSFLVASDKIDPALLKNYTIIVLCMDSRGKMIAQELLDQLDSIFLIDLGELKQPLCSWDIGAWKKWLQKEKKAKILYTSALIPYKFEERKGEYIQCLKILEEYGYKDRTYVVESGFYTPLSFSDDYCSHLFYAGTNDLSLVNKGVNEAKSLLSAFDYFNFNDEEMIVKLTGRYLFNDDRFLQMVESHPTVDAFVSPIFSRGIMTGCFAMRCKYFKRMLKDLDLDKMESKLIDIEWEVDQFLKKMIAENAKVIYLDKIGISANVSNVSVVQW